MNPFFSSRFVCAAACILAGAFSIAHAGTAGITVGSVDPVSRQVTIFKDLLVQKFRDGGAITKLYGGYHEPTGRYFLVRSGRPVNATCLTEVFDLIRTNDDRLVLATPLRAPWNPQILQKLAPTFDCTSTDCLFCEPSHGVPAMGEEPSCPCTQSSGALAGTCDTARPGTTSYKPNELIKFSL
jgi:hypothetical protein